jgi:glycosyltransferase involved in cell wall biosynthesis
MRCPSLSELPPPPPGKTGWPWTEECTEKDYTSSDKKNWQKFTIVTPSYNQGKYIEETIRSILLQGYPELEYIIIDGGSKDESVEIIKKYDKWLSFWISEKDSGQSNAINKGFKKATGDIINWVNSDDTLNKGVLFLLNHLFTKDIGIVIGRATIYGDTVKEYETVYDPTEVIERAIVGYAFAQPSCFIRRNALEAVGLLDESLHFTMDWDLYGKIVASHNHLLIKNIISRQLVHPEGKMVKNGYDFAQEAPRVFCKFINSSPYGAKYIPLLKQIGYYDESYKLTYDLPNLSQPIIDRSFQLFLYKMLHHEYNNHNSSKTLKLIQFIKKEFPSYYKKENLSSVYIKTILIPPFLKKMARVIKNKITN